MSSPSHWSRAEISDAPRRFFVVYSLALPYFVVICTCHCGLFGFLISRRIETDNIVEIDNKDPVQAFSTPIMVVSGSKIP